MTWTQFWDMHSGGHQKEDFSMAFLEAPEEKAMEIFTERYQHPYAVTCECCGEDYSVYEFPTLEEATSYERSGGQTLEEFLAQDNILVLYEKDLK